VAGGVAVLTTATGLAVVVVAAFVEGAGAPAAVAVVVGEATPEVVCGTAALTADVLVAVPSLAVIGAQGAALAAFGADGAAGDVVFFFPKSDPRLENAALAFVTAVLAVAGT